MSRISVASSINPRVASYCRPKAGKYNKNLVPCVVTGPPHRNHWKEDSSATKCNMTFCHRKFGLWERRHHCRKCGEIFCGSHCFHYIRLDQNANFNIEGHASRVCDRCYVEYVRLVDMARCFDYASERMEMENEYRRNAWNRDYRTMGSTDRDIDRTLLSKECGELQSDGNGSGGRCGQAIAPAVVCRWEFSTF